MRQAHAIIMAVIAAAGLAACSGKPETAHAVKPAKADPVAHESELLRLTLTPEAERRLGLKTVVVSGETAQPTPYVVQGEVVAAPLAGGLPLSASGDFTTIAANQARADGDVARARAELAIAEKTYVRAEGLVRDEAGSLRARDEAESARAVARAALSTAKAQRALLGPDMTRPGVRPRLWVRASVFASDLALVDRHGSAVVRPLSPGAAGVRAAAVQGPPTAAASTGALDLFYALPAASDFTLGQRVAVDMPGRTEVRGLLAPAAAVLRDIHGGEWVYVRTAPQAYERRRVEIASPQGDRALVVRGLTGGAQVVTDGAAELFGAEFGAK